MSKGLGAPGFIGCLHFGHKRMAQHRGFQDEFHHDENLIEQYNSVVNKKDLVYILGDITMENPDYYYQLDRLNGRKIVIMGNHDRPKDIPELLKYVESVAGMIHYKGFWLTHCPVHPQELNFVRGNIHCHIHEMTVPYTEVEVDYWDKPGIIKSKSGLLYHNVDAHLIDYKPKTLEQILEERDGDR